MSVPANAILASASCCVHARYSSALRPTQAGSATMRTCVAGMALDERQLLEPMIRPDCGRTR